MYLLNKFSLLGDKKKNNLLPKLGSKLGGIGFGLKRQVQGAKEGFKTGLDLGKKEFKRSGHSKLKNPVRVAAVEGTKIGAKLGKAVGTVEGKIKGYKKGKELQDKLPKFSSTFVVEFAKKQLTEKEKTKAIRDSAILGTAATGIGGIGVYEDVKRARNSIKDANKKAPEFIEQLAKNKKDLIKNHPDRFVGQGDNVINAAKKRFQELSNEKNNIISRQTSNQRYVDAGKQKLKGIVKAIGHNMEDDALKTATLLEIDNLKKTGKYAKLDPKDLAKIAKANKISKAIGIGVVGLTALDTGIQTARYLNRKRKERKDKGVFRGKYSK